jgi:putative ABC transport system substrate-binding protein
MRRREFITLIGGAAAAWPLAARAQKAARVRRIGVLMVTAESDPLGQQRVGALRAGLVELGWREGGNLQIDVRWSGGDANRLKDYTAELVRLVPDVIVTNGSPATAAMEQATRSIPIIFVVVSDPVEQGFIANLAHPGGNVTGFSFVDFPLFGKSLELLRQIAPKVTRVGLMFRPADHPYYDDSLKSLAADKQILPTVVARAAVGSEAEIEGEVAKLAAQPGGGVIVAADTHTGPSPGDHCIRGAAWRPRHPFLSRGRGGRRPDVLRARQRRHLPPLRRLRRSHSQGRETS